MAIFDYDSIPPGYYDFRNKGIRFKWHHAEFVTVENIVESHSPDVLIDLGCGPGVFTRNYCKEIPIKFGFDISEKQIAYSNALKEPGQKYFSVFQDLLEELEAVTKHKGHFRVALTFIELFEHLDSNAAQQMITELIKRISELGANSICLVFTTPNKKSLWPIVEIVIDLLLGTNYRDQHIGVVDFVTFKTKLENYVGHEVQAYTFMSLFQWLFSPPPLRPIRRFKFRGLLMLGTLTISYTDTNS